MSRESSCAVEVAGLLSCLVLDHSFETGAVWQPRPLTIAQQQATFYRQILIVENYGSGSREGKIKTWVSATRFRGKILLEFFFVESYGGGCT